MKNEDIIKESIERKLKLNVKSISLLGEGGSGSVYKVSYLDNDKLIAVKISDYPDLMKKEYEMLSLLRKETNSKVPEIYFYDNMMDKGIIGMEYIDGVSGKELKIKKKKDKKKLAEVIIKNLLEIQKSHNDKYGKYDNPIYNNWIDYYTDFSKDIYEFSKRMYEKNKLDKIVMKAVSLSYENLKVYFSEGISEPTLIHGDYWMPNFIIDDKKMELLACVDPFNMLWAESEYELFALDVGYGKKLKLYKTYKSKVNVSKYCDLKIEMYALYSELLWYMKSVPIKHSYLRYRAKRLIKFMKKL